MSDRQNNRNRNRSNNKSNQGNPRKKKRNRSKKHDPVLFWGDMDKLPTPERFVTESIEPLAVVHSLGRAPLPGALAEPYFAAVYDRAAGLAQVLSDAAGLDDLTPLDPPEPELSEVSSDDGADEPVDDESE